MELTTLKQRLEDIGYAASVFETKEEAAAYLNEKIDGKSVGLGGSVTSAQLGIYDLLKTHNAVYWHQLPHDKSIDAEIRKMENSADVYISSVNAISEKGEMVNIDGVCNRIAAIFYGVETVYMVIGKNKITPDLESAIWRARNIAAPRNAQRLNRKTPCAVKGDRCYDCSSPERICKGMQILLRKPSHGYYEIILVNEELGY